MLMPKALRPQAINIRPISPRPHRLPINEVLRLRLIVAVLYYH